jgi:hypothetical protein
MRRLVFACLALSAIGGWGATPEIRLSEAMPRPLKVGVTFLLNDIVKVNESNGNYLASIDLKLAWKDPSLAFDPNHYGTFRRELNLAQATQMLAKIWNPNVVIANMQGNPISKEPCLLIDADGSIMYIQRINAYFETPYDFAPFPFDTQELLVRLVSNQYDDSEIEFYQSQQELDQSGIREDVSVPGWNLSGIDYTAASFRGLDGRFYPEFTVQIGLKRVPLSHLFSFAPLLLIVIVPTILTLYASVDIGSRLSTWSGAILALIALGFSMQLRYPALPANGILSQMIAIIFAYEFLMICMTMSVFNEAMMSKVKNPYLIPEMTKFMRWQVPLTFLTVIAIAVLLTLSTG